MNKVKLRIKLSEEAYEILSAICNMYRVSESEAVEMALTDFWLKNLGINIIPTDNIQEDEVEVYVIGGDD